MSQHIVHKEQLHESCNMITRITHQRYKIKYKIDEIILSYTRLNVLLVLLLYDRSARGVYFQKLRKNSFVYIADSNYHNCCNYYEWISKLKTRYIYSYVSCLL